MHRVCPTGQSKARGHSPSRGEVGAHASAGGGGQDVGLWPCSTGMKRGLNLLYLRKIYPGSTKQESLLLQCRALGRDTGSYLFAMHGWLKEFNIEQGQGLVLRLQQTHLCPQNTQYVAYT